MTDITITDEQFYDLIRAECAAIAELLISKNKAYGNSILRSPNVFSKTTPLDKIADRLDDKLSRVMSGQEDDPEDAKLDIAGYLILERAVRAAMQNAGREVLQKPSTPPVAQEAKEAVKEIDAAIQDIGNQIAEDLETAAVEVKKTTKRKPATKKKTKKAEAAEVSVDIAAGLAEPEGPQPLTKTTEDDLTVVAVEDLLGSPDPSTPEPLASDGPEPQDGLMGLL